MSTGDRYPVALEVQYPERLSRLLIFVKWLLVLPQVIVLLFLGLASGFVVFIAFFAILFTASYPRAMFDFVVMVQRWTLNVNLYLALVRDEYPPFSGDADAYEPVRLTIEYPERLSRLMPFVKWLLAFPHYIVLYFVGVAVLVVEVIAWFAILFTGTIPRGLFDFIVGYHRWSFRVSAYAALLATDQYPPFALQ